MGKLPLLAVIAAAVVFFDTLNCASGFIITPTALSLPRCRSCFPRSNLKAAEGATETPETESEATAPPAAESETSPSSSLGLARRKAELMRLILDTSIEEKESAGAAEEVDAIIGEFETLKRGFQEDSVDGEWVLCFTRNSEGSPSLQKALPGDRGFQNFDVEAKQFTNIVRVWGGKLKVVADVGYEIRPEEPNKLVSTIVGAGVNLGPVRVPLPLTGRVGYLEFTYQDDDIRITRGNRGGLFLHMRPGSAFPVDSEEA
ncbi:unnamed protein product [Ectocarpus sp. 13 AM-2016]